MGMQSIQHNRYGFAFFFFYSNEMLVLHTIKNVMYLGISESIIQIRKLDFTSCLETDKVLYIRAFFSQLQSPAR